MAEKTVYLKGVRVFPKKENQPSFVIAQAVISIDELKEFLDNESKEWHSDYQGKKQLKIQINASTLNDGSVYIAVDTYKKQS